MFIAGALILPASADNERENLFEYFDQDGRWALLAIAAYAALSMWANWFLFATSPLSGIGAFVIAFGLVALAAFFSSDRRILGALTVLFLIMSVVGYVVLAPSEY